MTTLRIPRIQDVVRSAQFASVLTPVAILDEASADHNVAVTVAALGGGQRWRAHFKTARTQWGARLLMRHGVTRFKVSTVDEMAALLAFGAEDVLLAYPAVGPAPEHVLTLAKAYPEARLSALIGDVAALPGWSSTMDMFIDVDSGMRRTGVDIDDQEQVVALADRLRSDGHRFRGLHVYDGHLAGRSSADRQAETTAEVERIDRLRHTLLAAGHDSDEVVLGGSHTYLDLVATVTAVAWETAVTFGPGTVVYNDARSLERFAADGHESIGYRPAVGIASRVIAVGEGRATLDAGLTAIQVDAGAPHAVVAAHPDLVVGAPSQEHLSVSGPGAAELRVGDPLVLVPRHIDTALAQSDFLYRVGPDSSLVAEPIVAPREFRSPTAPRR